MRPPATDGHFPWHPTTYYAQVRCCADAQGAAPQNPCDEDRQNPATRRPMTTRRATTRRVTTTPGPAVADTPTRNPPPRTVPPRGAAPTCTSVGRGGCRASGDRRVRSYMKVRVASPSECQDACAARPYCTGVEWFHETSRPTPLPNCQLQGFGVVATARQTGGSPQKHAAVWCFRCRAVDANASRPMPATSTRRSRASTTIATITALPATSTRRSRASTTTATAPVPPGAGDTRPREGYLVAYSCCKASLPPLLTLLGLGDDGLNNCYTLCKVPSAVVRRQHRRAA